MEKRQAQDYIKQVFNSRFNQEQFELFIRNLLNEYEPRDNSYSGNLIPEAFRDHIAHYRRIGKYTDPEGESMDILIVQTRTVSKLERTRTALRNFVVRHLKNFDKQYAMVAFYSKEDDGSDWRLSLVKIDYESEKTDKGKIKIKEDIVPAKRFSFLVGEDEDAYTAQKQLLPLLVNDHSNPLIVKEKDGDGSIEGAFSVEKVTDEFFEQYKGLFKSLIQHDHVKASIEDIGLEPNRFVKKLLGQIVFLYFLQKKGWLGVPKDKKMGKGSKRFLQDRFEIIQANGQNYFNDFLRNLFYAALAKEHNDEGIKYYFGQLRCKIPFLNGGLFEAEYDWKNANILIPNNLFRNTEKNKAGDRGTGILDVFDRYNFTIKEDEPLEKEVAVDPEMLGKVFENMLEITERKSKGAFYTPREIVHYMCQESLIHYLDNTVNDYIVSYQAIGSNQLSIVGGSADKKGNLNLEVENRGEIRVPKEDIEIFIRKGHLALENEAAVQSKGKETDRYKYKLSENIRDHAQRLDDALAIIKICDPAIGSGAFPVGLLHEIVSARLVLNSFLQKKEHTPYYLKRHTIQKCIYGVDIDDSAIDIARLRLWLSMIVDEEDYDTIEALPNLDYKIVCGNSLIGLPGQGADRYPQLCDDLEDLKDRFFSETDDNKKRKLKIQINDKIDQVLKAAEDFEGYKIDFDFKLFFSEVWHQKGGFDVIIGNPPYVSHDRLTKEDKNHFKINYSVFEPYADLYCYFIEKAINLQNRKGILSFITSNSYLRAEYGKYVRDKIIHDNDIISIVNIEDFQIFSAAIVNACILISTKLRKKDSTTKVVNKVFDGKSTFPSFIDNNTWIYKKSDLRRKSWNLVEPNHLKLLKSIEGNHPTLEKLNTKIRLGLATGSNDAFIISDTQRLKFVNDDKKNEEIIKPILRGRDIDRYHFKPPEFYILLTRNGIDVEKDYPVLYEYFDSLGKKFKKRGAKGKHWTNLRACSFFDDFKKEQIIWIELSDKGRFALLEEEIYLLNSAYFLLPPKQFTSKYLLAILNSSIIHFYLLNTAETSGMGTSRWINNHVKEFPIAVTNRNTQSLIDDIVTYLILIKNKSIDQLISVFFDSLIDSLVFELYFPEEIRIANKQFLHYLDDLRPLTNDMSDEEKVTIIQNEFERLYDPNHPVRNNMETLDSVEEVRIIKEALK